MYHVIEARFRAALAEHVLRRYGAEVPIVTERPPNIALGELATPVCFELARRLKRAPRQIAAELAAEIAPIEGIARLEPAGGGYLNAFFDRGAFFAAAVAGAGAPPPAPAADAPKVIVEHTNINPNKAAHIGHLRNAALGDTFVRLLRRAGQRVEVQNYIDNTGVQVADVVVGFLHLEKKTLEQVRALARQGDAARGAPAAAPRFDYLCWDVYARVTQFFEEDPARLELRAATLKAIEEGHGETAEMAEVIATSIVRCHLATMERLDVEYDALPRESEILHLKFWDAAFELLKKSGAIQLAASGKNRGCWVMPLGAAEGAVEEEEAGAKIIVRSNGTVTYVGKDIAYQLWKFGLLGRDFAWRRFHTHPSGRQVWVSTSGPGEAGAPPFGGGHRVYNVIDSRQAYLQNIVEAGLRALGYHEQAGRSVHFAYEMVALSPRCAAEMGYAIPPEERKRPYVEVSGRKGTGVKADDLLDLLEQKARREVDARHPALPGEERAHIARAIAIGALRYYLLKYTRNTVVAFDFQDALSFEGETGPYCQYAVVRARNIFRKLREQQPDSPYAARAERRGMSRGAPRGNESAAGREGPCAAFLAAPGGDELWDIVLLAGSLGAATEAAVAAQEPAFVAKYAFQLAQAFNNFYHKHHILSEADRQRQAFLLELTALVECQLTAALGVLGIAAPEKM